MREMLEEEEGLSADSIPSVQDGPASHHSLEPSESGELPSAHQTQESSGEAESTDESVSQHDAPARDSEALSDTREASGSDAEEGEEEDMLGALLKMQSKHAKLQRPQGRKGVEETAAGEFVRDSENGAADPFDTEQTALETDLASMTLRKSDAGASPEFSACINVVTPAMIFW